MPNLKKYNPSTSQWEYVVIGKQGPTGPTGATGPQGDPGLGIPAGGTTGQLLAKASGIDYQAQWVTPDASSGISTGKAIAMAMVFG